MTAWSFKGALAEELLEGLVEVGDVQFILSGKWTLRDMGSLLLHSPSGRSL